MRLRLHRRPLVFWALAVGLSVVTGLTVSRVVGEAAARAERLGGLREVPVAARPVDAGQVLGEGDVTMRRLPAAAVPDGPLARSPVGHTTLVPLARGEVVLESKLAPFGLKGVAALVPPGRRALAVPAGRGGLAVRPGQRVDVLATFDAAEGGEPTLPVATAALVVDVADEAVTVAVRPDEAPRLAFAVARGTVTLALTSP